MSKPTVIVYGATSYTGKELLNYFDTHPQNAEFDVILAGRNGAKLQTAAGDLQKRHETVTCRLDNEDEVRNLVARGNVVINLAGELRYTAWRADMQVHSGETMPRR
jgi:short subunit dehydrogenase-like uncharacterized protein